ncbi:MAG: sulfite exporter TauE/SafE family protein, partial [Pseudolysinimonas sp.]
TGPEPPVPRRTVREVLLLILIGAIGGVLSGAFGVGGGIIMIPLLTTVAKLDQRRASATSLVAIIPAAIVGTVTYGAAGHLDVLAAVLIAAGGVAGSFVGTRLLRSLSMRWLRWLFIGLLVLVAVRLFFEIPARSGTIALTPVSIPGLVVLGFVIGIASGLFGIGGGVIIVPILVAVFGAGDLLAKGTSLLAIIPGALTGTIRNARAGLVDVIDGTIVGVTAAIASFGGVAIASALAPQLATILFALLLLAATVQLVVRAVRDERRPQG